MTKWTGKEITTIHILPSTSRSKCKQIMKFGQLIVYNFRNIFLQIAGNGAGRLVLDLFLFSKTASFEVKVDSTLVSICLYSPQPGHTIKTNCMNIQTVDPKICFILSF